MIFELLLFLYVCDTLCCFLTTIIFQHLSFSFTQSLVTWWIDVSLEIFALNKLVLTVTCSSQGRTGISTEKPQFDQHNSGEGPYRERVARCRITFINHRNVIGFLWIFSFYLTYINYIMACQNNCNSTVMYSMLCTRAFPLRSVLPLIWHLYHVQSCTTHRRFGQRQTAYMTVVP
jgi:hypothetical protein